MSTKKHTADAVTILQRRYIGEDPARKASLEQERLHAKVARQIFELRTRAGLSQKELAEKVQTTQSVISRLEDADYEGHSLSMLRRIADVLGVSVDVDLEPAGQTIRPFVFRTFLQFLRRSKGLTLDQLANETDIPRNELVAIEQQEGYRPLPRTVYLLSRYYNLSPAKLAALAGATEGPAAEIRDPAFRFAAMSESFSELSREEKRALTELVGALREESSR
jgi:transcriptional regulator with XRE-family HTH domain